MSKFLNFKGDKYYITERGQDPTAEDVFEITKEDVNIDEFAKEFLSFPRSVTRYAKDPKYKEFIGRWPSMIRLFDNYLIESCGLIKE